MQNRRISTKEISAVNNMATKYLQPAKYGTYVCPICGSGSGSNKTGISTKDGIHWTCWAGNCFKNADFIDIAGLIADIPDDESHFPERFRKAAELVGYDIQDRESSTINSPPAPKPSEQKKEPLVDYTDYYQSWNSCLNQTDYHRGISTDTLNRFNVGFCEMWSHPKDISGAKSPRLIIPTSANSYVARLVLDDPLSVDQRIRKVGPVSLFNVAALDVNAPIFVTEGEIDALSIIDAGFNAIGLGSISMIRHFLEEIDNREISQPIIIALDSDEAGKKAAENLHQELKKRNIYHISQNNLYQEFKDANEFLQSDKRRFQNALRAAQNNVLAGAERNQEDQNSEAEEYLAKSALNELRILSREVVHNVERPFSSTGFSKLDELLCGGLYNSRIYVLGAASSTGKTAFCLQIADQIAIGGRDVAYFSVEMPTASLVGRSLSRLSYEISQDYPEYKNAVKCENDIIYGYFRKNFNELENDLIDQAEQKYSQYAGNLFIHEKRHMTTGYIKAQIDLHKRVRGIYPVVIIDYLQLLLPATDKMQTDKQEMDEVMADIMDIGQTFGVPVLVISSYARANYDKEAGMASFKESGSIEYDADVLLALQYRAVGDQQKLDLAKEKKKNPREVEVVMLKGRNGKGTGKVEYDYYAEFNCFYEHESL